MKIIFIRIFAIICITIFLSSCSVPPKIEVVISEAIFINPEYLYKKPLYLSIKNQTDLFNIESSIYQLTSSLLLKKGFTLTKNTNEADYKIDIVVLNLIKNIDDSLSKRTLFSSDNTIKEAISKSMADEVWHIDIEVKIEEPVSILSKKQIDNNNIKNSTTDNRVSEETRSSLKTKIRIKIYGAEVKKEDVIEYLVEALSYRVASFF